MVESTAEHVARVRREHAGQARPKYYGANVDPVSGMLFDAYADPAPPKKKKGPNAKLRARAKAARQARKKNRS